MKSNRIELPADKQSVENFVKDSTEQGSEHFVYVLECTDRDKKTAREQVKKLYNLGTKEDLRYFQEDYNTEDLRYFQKNINTEEKKESAESGRKKLTEHKSGFNPPSWYYLALDAEKVYYVGYTASVYSRIDQHMEGASSGGAYFTSVFPPTHLVEVYGFQDKERAYEAEIETGSKLTSDNKYAYNS